MLRKLLLLAPLLPLLGATPAAAQMESREGIALQNQILQLRQEMESLRRGGGGGFAPPVPVAPQQQVRGGAAPELVGQLLDRVGQLEEEVRRLRGQNQEAEYRVRTTQQALEKLQGDVDYRLQQLEQGGGARPGGSAPAAAPRPQQRGEAEAPASPAAAAAPRTAERALADGQAALTRRDYATAEAAAREVISARNSARAQDAQLLLGDALLGKRDYQNAALAYDDAYRRNRNASRAPEALLGLANAFLGFGAKREACATLDDLRSDFPRLSGNMAERATEARRRGGCR